MNLKQWLTKCAEQAFITAGLPKNITPQLQPAKKSTFGHYQINGVMAAAKQTGKNPVALAQKIATYLTDIPAIRLVEVAGPGFINLFLEMQWIATQVAEMYTSRNFAIQPVTPQSIVVDYSSPNVAKTMHVGHLRSTVIGDAMVRILTFLGNKVTRVNHIGDWGTQFGLLIAYIEQNHIVIDENSAIETLAEYYRAAKKQFDQDENFAENARQCVVQLQNKEAHCIELWQALVKLTVEENQHLYQRLQVLLQPEDICGESFYNDMLPAIIQDLQQQGLVVKHDGAQVVFLPGYKNKNNEPMGVIVQKKDGGYLYTTADLACIKYRSQTLKAQRVIYCVDSRQQQHLQQIFKIARQAGYVDDEIKLEHHMFGMVLDKTGKPFKTRSGANIKLADLLDEAVSRAEQLIISKQPLLNDDEKNTLAEAVGIGAVKYADLSKHRTTDYIFDWDHMLSFEGNTSPYIQYAYTRIKSLLKRANFEVDKMVIQVPIILSSLEEQQLALRLLQFEEMIHSVAIEGLPHLLCSYIYDVATLFSRFYEACPVLAEQIAAPLQKSRLTLAHLTARILQQGLSLLGITTVEKM